MHALYTVIKIWQPLLKPISKCQISHSEYVISYSTFPVISIPHTLSGPECPPVYPYSTPPAGCRAPCLFISGADTGLILQLTWLYHTVWVMYCCLVWYLWLNHTRWATQWRNRKFFANSMNSKLYVILWNPVHYWSSVRQIHLMVVWHT